MHDCATCRFEEFFLSSWAVGDPAMVVDIPANAVDPKTKQDRRPARRPRRRLYPDDPSNVYHSYMGDHVKFQILHAGTNISHVHHLHAHQWLHTPNDDKSSYRDSQMISPGGSYTLDHTYSGSGNKNKTVGDSIFHCHFYPHFAQGMWSLWRVHDVFEGGTQLDAQQRPVAGFEPRAAGWRDRAGHPDPGPRADADACRWRRSARASGSLGRRAGVADPCGVPHRGRHGRSEHRATAPAFRSSSPASRGSARRIRRWTSRRTRPTPPTRS